VGGTFGEVPRFFYENQSAKLVSDCIACIGFGIGVYFNAFFL
jgi:hypothetical protein